MTSTQDSQQKLYYGIHPAPSSVSKKKVLLTIGDSFSSLTLKKEDNYLSVLSLCMLMMLQMLWTMTTLPLHWKAL